MNFNGDSRQQLVIEVKQEDLLEEKSRKFSPGFGRGRWQRRSSGQHLHQYDWHPSKPGGMENKGCWHNWPPRALLRNGSSWRVASLERFRCPSSALLRSPETPPSLHLSSLPSRLPGRRPSQPPRNPVVLHQSSRSRLLPRKMRLHRARSRSTCSGQRSSTKRYNPCSYNFPLFDTRSPLGLLLPLQIFKPKHFHLKFKYKYILIIFSFWGI